MRLVFTKLETPKNKIEIDFGTGEFEEVSLESLQDSEAGKYIQLSDTVPTNSIRIKVNSSEASSFDMIKDYQITDDEGNIIGGNASQITFPLELVEYVDTEHMYLFKIMFPHDITEPGEYVGLTSNEALGPYFRTIVVTKIDSAGFRGHPIGADGDSFFVKSISEENH